MASVKNVDRVRLQCLSENISTFEDDPSWVTKVFLKDKKGVNAQIAFEKEQRESKERRFGVEFRHFSHYPQRVEPVVAFFPGSRFIVVAVKKPEGWEPRHSLDVPPHAKSDDGFDGYPWSLSQVEGADCFQTRKAAFKEASYWNSDGPRENSEEDDWQVVVELAYPVGEVLVHITIIDGMGCAKVKDMHMPIRVVHPTKDEVKALAGQPWQSQVVAGCV